MHSTIDGKGWMRIDLLEFSCVGMLALGIIAASACSPRDETEPSVAGQDSAGVRPVGSAYVRGIAVRAADPPRFVPCGTADTLRLVDANDALANVKLGTTHDALFTVLKARIEADTAVTIERVMYASSDRGKCYNDWSGFDYRASGTSPGWVAEINGTDARLRREGDVNDGWSDVQKDSTAGRVRFFAAAPGEFELVLEAGPCTGSGTWSPWTARVLVGDKQLRGCAVVGR